MSSDPVETIRFGPFEVNRRAGELRKHGLRIRLSGQPFEILSLLLKRAGEVVTREELREKLWPGNTFVDFDHSLNAAVNKLREALGDSAEAPRFVETLPRRGYRFIAALAEAPREAVVPTAEPATAKPTWRRWWTPIAIALAGVLILAVIWGRSSRPWTERPAAPQIWSLAVLPFQNLSRDPEQDYFADGMTEAVISRLSQIGALHVISRTSVMPYKNSRQSLPQIARALGVEAIVEGAVQRSGNRVLISAKLIDAASDRNLWASSYERSLENILALQSDVARAIAEEIRVQITPQERVRLAWSRSINPEAYQLYLKARYDQSQGMLAGTRKAVGHFHQAIAQEPDWALAHAGLAEAEVFGYPPKEAMSRAKASALRAIQLDPRLSEAHTVLGLVRMFWDWDWAGAEASFQRALELNPNSADAHHRYSHYLAAMGRFDEAVAECRRALALDPLSANIGHYLGRIHYFARQYDAAIDRLRRTLELDRNNFWTNFFLAVVYERKQMYTEAVQQWQRAASLSGARPEEVALLQQLYERSGYEAVLRGLLRWDTTTHEAPLGSSAAALRLARLGEKEEALQWLERAFESHTRDLIYLNVEPAYDPLRGDPRFAALLRRLAFPAR